MSEDFLHKDVPVIGESEHKEFYDLMEKILQGVYLGKLTFEQAVDIIHDMCIEEMPDGECAKNIPD